MLIEIKNWDKYNPRKDLKSLTWLRLDSDIGFSESLFGLNAEARWLWVFLLSFSAKKNKPVLTIDVEYIAYHSSVKKENIYEYISSFAEKKLIEVKSNSSRIRTDPIENVFYDTNDTNDTNERDGTNETERDASAKETSEIPSDILNTIKSTMLYPDEIIEEVRKDAWLKYQASNRPDKNWRRWIGNYFHNEKTKIQNLILEKANAGKKQSTINPKEMANKIYGQVVRVGRDGVKEVLAGFNPLEIQALDKFGLASEIYNCPNEFAANDIKKRLVYACEQVAQQTSAAS